MIRPKIPVNPLPTGLVMPLVQSTTDATVEPHHGAVPACGCDHTATPAAKQPRVQLPAVRLTPAGLVAAVAGGAGLVLVVGAVLVSMLLAVAITGASVAVCAVVLRSLLNQNHR
ncbi:MULTISPECIES: SpdD-like protein [unclassified Streptomyces]|uniref:SpdD-like protein n=1 Tax=unclassified Streptomyces TaxID=2593676 RepID=UPI000DC7ABFE|nr:MULTISPECIES: SpdD-like protein [unclassified Streptomyces]AWZ05146.1 SpdD-like protein [Streptomyces sp. ICC4]AWZ11576.1 SpdD-like protein [Streptomyces sp. ICC1]